MNEYRFIGIVQETPTIVESEKGNKYCNIFLDVKKPFTNAEGKNEKDSFKITCFRQTAEETCKTIKKGDQIIVRGRIQQNNYFKDDNKLVYLPELIGERIEIIN